MKLRFFAIFFRVRIHFSGEFSGCAPPHYSCQKYIFLKLPLKQGGPHRMGEGTNLNGKHLHISKNMFSIIIIHMRTSCESDFYCVLYGKS